jgi:hypothetical protein
MARMARDRRSRPRPPRGGHRRTDTETRSPSQRRTVVLGLLAAPGLAHELAQRLTRELPELLGGRFPGTEWRVVARREPMAAASHSDVDLVEIARRRMLAEGWDIAVCLTDFPIHIGRSPVTAFASAAHGVGLVSVPALGAINLDERLRDAVVRVVEGTLGESVQDPERARDHERDARMRQRLEDLATLEIGRPEVQDDRAVRFVAAVGLGNLRLLIGMVHANRPWRLIAGLSRAIVGALGIDIFGVASPGIWIISDGQTWWRLAILCATSILVISASLIVAHRLWERRYSPRPETQARVVLFNLTTAISVMLGVLTLYLALFIINMVASAVLITPHVLERQLGHPADVSTYVRLAWLVTSLATLGGALGAALENDRAVRQAAYGYREDARTEALGEEPGAASGAEPRTGRAG